MTVWVNWGGAAEAAAGLAVLLGLTLLLRGGRAAVRMCVWVGLCEIGYGIVSGRIIAGAAGAVTTGCACWCLTILRRCRKGGGAR